MASGSGGAAAEVSVATAIQGGTGRVLRAVPDLPGLKITELLDGSEYPEGALTPASVAEVLRCSAEFKFRRLDHVEEEMTAALRWKSLIRGATRAFVAALKEKKSLEDARAAAMTAALEQLQKLDGEIAAPLLEALPEALERIAERSWASGTPLLAGNKYVLQLDGALPVVARVDLALERNGDVVVVGYAIGADVEDALERAERDGTITAACLAVEEALQRPVRHAEVHLYTRQKDKVAIVPTTRGGASRARLLSRIQMASAIVTGELFGPTDAPAICVRCPFGAPCSSTFGNPTE